MSLEVLIPPTITATTSKQTWKDTDDKTVLSCPSNANPPATITWYKLGHDLNDFFKNGRDRTKWIRVNLSPHKT